MRRLDFGSWCNWLDWSSLLGGELLQADASFLKHLLNGDLLLKNLLYLILMEDDREQRFKFAVRVYDVLSPYLADPELSVEHRFVLAADGAAVSECVQRCRVQVVL